MEGCKQTTLGSTYWEVPIGTVREGGFPVLRNIAQSGFPYPALEMTGQHPKAGGPNQGKIVRDPDYLTREYPSMEYWRGCRVVEDNVQIKRPLIIDHPDTSYYIPSTPSSKAAGAAELLSAHGVRSVDKDGHIISKLPNIYVEFVIQLANTRAN